MPCFRTPPGAVDRTTAVSPRSPYIDDPYRRGMLTVARATSRAERAWLREMLA